MPPTRSGAAGLAVAVSLALSAVIAAPVAAADSPEAAVNALIDAVEAGDYAALDDLVCEAERASVREMLDPSEAMGISMEEFPITISIADRSLEVISDDGDEATIRLTGSMSMNVEEDQLEALAMAAMAADMGEVSEEDLEMMLPFLMMAFTQTTPMDEELTVVNEGGQWLVCGGLGEAPADDLGFDDEFGIVSNVSTDGVCGLVLPEELTAAGQLTYDTSSGWDISNCTYSSSDFESYHSATVFVELDTDAQSNAGAYGADQTLEVAGSPAYASSQPNVPFFVQVGPDMLNISVWPPDPAPDGYDQMAQTMAIAELFVPRIVDSRAELIPPVLPLLCDLTFAVDFETTTGLVLNGGNVSPDFCNFESRDNAYVNANLSPGTLDDFLMFSPDAEELIVAGLPAVQLDDQFNESAVEFRIQLPDEQVLMVSVQPYAFDKPMTLSGIDVVEALTQHVLERRAE